MPAADAESLIAYLSGGLHPDDRDAFRRAAESALANSAVCWGPGLIHRTVTSIWRQYFHPPVMVEHRTGWDLADRPRSQLIEQGNYHHSRRLRIVS